MKKDIHPENYRLVAFKDMSNNDVFLTKSTADTKETLEVEGVEYPLVKLEISRTSHPFYTGKAKFWILLGVLISSRASTINSRKNLLLPNHKLKKWNKKQAQKKNNSLKQIIVMPSVHYRRHFFWPMVNLKNMRLLL